jgi:hypothetical protein
VKLAANKETLSAVTRTSMRQPAIQQRTRGKGPARGGLISRDGLKSVGVGLRLNVKAMGGFNHPVGLAHGPQGQKNEPPYFLYATTV